MEFICTPLKSIIKIGIYKLTVSFFEEHGLLNSLDYIIKTHGVNSRVFNKDLIIKLNGMESNVIYF